MALGFTQNYHSIFFILAVFVYFDFIAFETRTLSENKVHHVPFRLFNFKKFPIQPEEENREGSGTFIVSLIY